MNGTFTADELDLFMDQRNNTVVGCVIDVMHEELQVRAVSLTSLMSSYRCMHTAYSLVDVIHEKLLQVRDFGCLTLSRLSRIQPACHAMATDSYQCQEHRTSRLNLTLLTSTWGFRLASANRKPS